MLFSAIHYIRRFAASTRNSVAKSGSMRNCIGISAADGTRRACSVLSRLAPFAPECARRELFSCGLHDAERDASVMEEVTASAGG